MTMAAPTHAGSLVMRVGRLARRQLEDCIAVAQAHGVNLSATHVSSGLLDHTYRIDFVGTAAEAEWVDDLFERVLGL